MNLALRFGGVFFICGFLCSWHSYDAKAQGVSTETFSEALPQVYSVVPRESATIRACRFPGFQNPKADNPVCAGNLVEKLSNTPMPQRAGASVTSSTCAKSINVNTASQNAVVCGENEGCPGAYVLVAGMSKEISVPQQYNASAAILVNWTVRLAGSTRIVNPWTYSPRLCHPWHGTIDQHFGPGKVSTALYVNGVKKGLAADLSLPDAGIVTSSNKHDPTAVGSYIITPKDFADGEFPANINIDVYWQNDSCMDVVSEGGQRSLVITFMPQGKK